MSLIAVPAAAGDWSVTGVVRETLEVDTNKQVTTTPSPAFRSTTQLRLQILRESATASWRLLPGLSASFFAGERGASGGERIDPSLSSSFQIRSKRLTLGGSMSLDVEPTSESQILDTGIVEEDVTEVRVSLGTQLSYAMDPRNRTTLAGTATLVRFTDEATLLTPTTVYGFTAAWEHDLSRTTSTSIELGTSRFSADNATQTRSLSFDLSGGVTHQFHPRLSGVASLGGSLTRTSRVFGGIEEVTFEPGLIASLSLNWRATPDTNFRLSISQSREASSAGELQSQQSLQLGMRHAISARMDWDAAVLYASRDSTAGTDAGIDNASDIVQLSTSLGYSLTPDWRAELGYRMRLSSRPSGESIANRLFLTISRDLIFLD